jgi:hypothetical protein
MSRFIPSGQTARSAPHIARFNDNVLEPLRESTGPNAIWQLRFDARTGRLAVYRIQGETGALTPLATYAVGQRPMAVLVTQVGG